jgi:hypothetical protein
MIYEYRAYYAAPGRMPDIQKRFNDVTMKLFAKHGIKVIGFWDTIVGESNELVYICAFDDLAHRTKAWASFQADPEWIAARKASEANGPLLEKVKQDLEADALLAAAVTVAPRRAGRRASGGRVPRP